MSLKLNERYPGRYNNPSADYPQGSFKNRTAPGAKDGSYLEQDWANDKEGFFQSLLSLAGITPNGSVDKVGASQFFDALLKLKQNQYGTAFPTTGPSAAMVLTPSPAITAYSAGQRFRVKFNRASTGTDTINISGVGPKNLKQYDASGAKVAAVFAIDQLSDVEYDGTDAVLLDPLPVANSNLVGVRGCFSGLKASTTGTSAVVTVSADELMVESSSNTYQTLRAVAVTPSFGNAGVNGLDVGAANSQTASTWYAVWVIWNGTTKAGLLSLSTTAPTLPAGYTHAALVSMVLTDATANKYPLSIIQSGRKWQYVVRTGSNVAKLPIMISGVNGSPTAPTFIPVGLSGFFPPNSASIILSAFAEGTVSLIAAPNNNYGAINSANQPMININLGGTSGIRGSYSSIVVPESANFYYASNATTSGLTAIGGELNI